MTKTDLRSRQLNIYMMASSSLITMAPVKELGHNGTVGHSGGHCNIVLQASYKEQESCLLSLK